MSRVSGFEGFDCFEGFEGSEGSGLQGGAWASAWVVRSRVTWAYSGFRGYMGFGIGATGNIGEVTLHPKPPELHLKSTRSWIPSAASGPPSLASRLWA